MTPRTVTAWGLIAGIGYEEQKELTPGYLCDLFVIRRGYDDEQHGITRVEDDHDIDREDAALFDHYDEIAEAEKRWMKENAKRD